MLFNEVDDASVQWVGLDTGLKNTSACLTSASGEIIEETVIPSSAELIAAYLSTRTDPAIAIIGMEACLPSIPLAKGLRRFGFSVKLLDPYKVRCFASIRMNKTDKNDARSIAAVIRIGDQYVGDVHLKSDLSWSIRTMLVSRHNIIKQSVVSEKVFKSILRLYGAKIDFRKARIHIYRGKIMRIVEELREDAGIDLSDQVMPLVDLYLQLRKEADRLKEKIAAFSEAHPVCRRFVDIPGVSGIIAASFLTAIDDPVRFRRSSDVGAYLGLSPKIYETAGIKRKRGITRRGNLLTRNHMCTAATSILYIVKTDFALRRWGLERASQIGYRRARIAVARKLSVIMFTMWRNGTDFAMERGELPEPPVCKLSAPANVGN